MDNENVPVAEPQSLNFVGRIYSTPTDGAGRHNATMFESTIYGSVESNSGKGIARAVIRVTSADGGNSFTTTTGPGGVYHLDGLGCTTWNVRLVSIPDEKIQANIVTVRNLNGGHLTAAEVRFKLQQ